MTEQARDPQTDLDIRLNEMVVKQNLVELQISGVKDQTVETLTELLEDQNPDLIELIGNSIRISAESEQLIADSDWVDGLTRAGVSPQAILQAWDHVDEMRRQEKEKSQE